MAKHITNLGEALSILAHAEAAEHFAHADVDAFGAPGECHSLVSRNEEKRQNEALRKAEALTGATFRDIRQQSIERGKMDPCSGDPRWQSFVGRVYQAHYPF